MLHLARPRSPTGPCCETGGGLYSAREALQSRSRPAVHGFHVNVERQVVVGTQDNGRIIFAALGRVQEAANAPLTVELSETVSTRVPALVAKDGVSWAHTVPFVRLKNAASLLLAPCRRVGASLFDQLVDVHLARALENCPWHSADCTLIGPDAIDGLTIAQLH
eukprot:scaffold103471_cov72-Phaeocystis_antarctica.AAC.10